MNLTYDALFAQAKQHQAGLRREAEVARMLRTRKLESGRTVRIVLPPIPWPRALRQPAASRGEVAA